MQQGKYKDISTLRKLFLLLVFIFMGTVAASFATLGLKLINPNEVTFLKASQVLSLIGLFIFPAVSSAYLFSDNWKKFLYLDQPVRIDKLLYTGVLALTMQPFLSWIVYWNNQIKLPAFLSGVEIWMQNMEAQMNDTVQLLLVTNSFGTFLVNVLIIAVLTAIGEEFFFRGTLQRILTDATKKPYLAAIVIGILFSIIHFQFYGFFARAFMGIFFGIMVVNSKSLLLPIVAHAVNNAYGVFMYYYCTKNDIPIETFDNPSEPPTLWIVAVSLLVSALIYRSILRIIRDKRAG